MSTTKLLENDSQEEDDIVDDSDDGGRSCWRRSKRTVVVVMSFAIFIDLILFGIIIPILPRLLAECKIPRDRTDLYQSLLYGAYAIGMLIATPIFGIVSDRLRNRQAPMLLGVVILIFTTLTFAYVRSFGLLLVARIFQGVAAAATWVVGYAMVSDAYPSDKGLGMALGLVMASQTAGCFAGPLIGGFLGEYFGLQYPFLLCLALSMFDLLGRLIVIPPTPKIPDTEGAGRLGIVDLILDRNVLLTMLAVLIISSSYSSIELFVASWLETDWGYSESRTSQFMLGFIVPKALMVLIVGWLSDNFSRRNIVTVGLVIHGLAAPLVPLSKNVTMLIIFEVLFGATAPMVKTPLSPHLAHIVELKGEASYARVYALLNITYGLGMLIGPWAVGVIKSKTNFFLGMCVITATALPAAPLFYFLTNVINQRKSINEAPTEDPQEAHPANR